VGRLHRFSSLLPPVVVALAVSFTVGGASAPPIDRPDPTAASKGGLIYQRYCTSCHGLTARGDGPVAPSLRTRVPDLTTIAVRHHGRYPFERVVRVIEGRQTARVSASADMPAWAEVFGKTRGTETASPEVAINDLAHYLWSLQSVVGDAVESRSVTAP
jgi:mono/diheme cytochrome c family protein